MKGDSERRIIGALEFNAGVRSVLARMVLNMVLTADADTKVDATRRTVRSSALITNTEYRMDGQ